MKQPNNYLKYLTMKHSLIIYFLLFLTTQLFAQAGVHEYFDWPNSSSGNGSMDFGVTICTIGGWFLSTYYLHKKFDTVGFIIGFFFGAPVSMILYLEIFG